MEDEHVEDASDLEDADLQDVDLGAIEGDDSEMQTVFVDDSIMSFGTHERKKIFIMLYKVEN